jgi:acyl-CoA thioester hydrolase
MSREHEFDLEVRYYETDAQGVVHHSNYFRYFELARVELLKAVGHSYADLEAAGVLLVVSKIQCKFHYPGRYGETLRIWIRTERARGARIDHRYRITCNGRLVAEGESTIACIDRSGQVQRIPEYLEIDE